jgi:hypothetical protein
MNKLKYFVVVTDLKIKVFIAFLILIMAWFGLIADDRFDGFIDGIISEALDLKEWEVANGY